MEKTKGWKIVSIRVINNSIFFDIALFGDNSLMVENFQLCESFLKSVPFEEKEKVIEGYGTELENNFINDMLIIH